MPLLHTFVPDEGFGNKQMVHHATHGELELYCLKGEAESARLESIVAKVANCQLVSGDELMDLARHLGVSVHPRTAGMIRKKVDRLHNRGAAIHGKKSQTNINSAVQVYVDCVEAIQLGVMEEVGV